MTGLLSKEIAKLLHGKYIEETPDELELEQKKRNQEAIDKFWGKNKPNEQNKKRSQNF